MAVHTFAVKEKRYEDGLHRGLVGMPESEDIGAMSISQNCVAFVAKE